MDAVTPINKMEEVDKRDNVRGSNDRAGYTKTHRYAQPLMEPANGLAAAAPAEQDLLGPVLVESWTSSQPMAELRLVCASPESSRGGFASSRWLPLARSRSRLPRDCSRKASAIVLISAARTARPTRERRR